MTEMQKTFDTVDTKAAEAEFFLQKMATAGLDEYFFRLHDMVRKGQSESKEKAISGKSALMQKRDNVKPN